MEENNSAIRTMSGLNFIFGIWLIISPYILSYTTAQAKWEQTVAGIVVLILAAIRYAAPKQMWTSWVNAAVGVWLIIAPFATGYQSGAAFWNEVIFGILVAIVGISNGLTRGIGHTGHHHQAV
ncbi:MAG TPA: SPW repeat protein [Candidatus Saccharimonadales bacterium]|nr:SPW repeat protein [Candidatus Saccharimonadales bacterium]